MKVKELPTSNKVYLSYLYLCFVVVTIFSKQFMGPYCFHRSNQEEEHMVLRL